MIRRWLVALRRRTLDAATTYTWRGQQITRHDFDALRSQGYPVTEVDAAVAVRTVRDRARADWDAWEQEVNQ